MIRLAACGLVAALVGAPLAILPSPFVVWLALPALVLGVAGVVTLSMPFVTASAAVALIEYALALLIARAPVDLAAGVGFGTALFLLLEVVHFAGRVHGASLGPSVLASQLRAWLLTAALGGLAAVVLTAAGAALQLVSAGASLPAVVIAGALGALAVSGGLILLVTRGREANN